MAVIRVVTCQAEVALHVLEDDLHVRCRHRQVACHRQDDLEHVLVVVANTPVQVEKRLVRVFLELGRQSLHLFVAKGDLGATIFLFKQVSERSNALIRFVLLP